MKAHIAMEADLPRHALPYCHHAIGMLPKGLERILIVGAGGFGREVLRWARDAWPNHASLLAGFLSADALALEGFDCGLPIVSDPGSFEPRAGDGFVLGIGIPDVRRRVAEDLMARGGRFLTLVHPTTIVDSTAIIGPGSILCPGAIVTAAARLGRCVLVNYHASVAHDAVAGDFAVLSPYAVLAGNAVVGEDAFLGLHASVGPAIKVGPRTRVAANSCVLRDAPADSLVLGVPGRVSPRTG